jgi:glycosyltransferase involved in cell wall biosynthesis
MIRVSVITINKNNSEGLRRTIKSVLGQKFTSYEYIIIDGGSTDGSTDIIKEFSGKISYWISEPDTGIYNAMNKGLKIAKGEYCLFLNSGDTLVDSNILSKVFNAPFTEDIVFGSVILDGKERKEVFEIPDISNLTFRHFIKSTIPHPGTFIKRSLFERVGCFNENYRICSDLEFFLVSIFIHGATMRKLPEIISVFDWNGISSMPENALLVEKERTNILKNHFPRFLDDYEYLEKLEHTNMELEYKLRRSIGIRLVNAARKIKNKVFH